MYLFNHLELFKQAIILYWGTYFILFFLHRAPCLLWCYHAKTQIRGQLIKLIITKNTVSASINSLNLKASLICEPQILIHCVIYFGVQNIFDGAMQITSVRRYVNHPPCLRWVFTESFPTILQCETEILRPLFSRVVVSIPTQESS